MITDDELTTRLARADAASNVRTTPETRAETLDALLVATGELEALTRPRRFRRVALISGGVVASLAVTAASPVGAHVIDSFVALTGWNPAPSSEIIENSPWVNTGASDFEEYARTIYPADLALPASVSSETVFDYGVAAHQQNPGTTQAISVVRTFETAAQCAWLGEFSEARAGGDTARADAALAVIRASADWPAIVATDGGGIADGIRDFADNAVDGDVRIGSLGIDCAGFDAVQDAAQAAAGESAE